MMDIFDPLDEEFGGRVRSYVVEQTSFTSYGESHELTEGKAYIDSEFNLKIFDRLHKPAILGIERVVDEELWYSIFEVATVKAYHLEMGSLKPDIPPSLKWDALDRIEESWFKGGENWMSIEAVNTGYRIKPEAGGLEVVKDNLSPLVGSRVHILSGELYKTLVNKESGYSGDIGDIVGYNVGSNIDLYSLFRYHTGIFGYTGTGKSNLVSMLLRKLLDTMDNLSVLVFDVSGEYPVNIMDILYREGRIYLDQSVNMERFLDTLIYPDTLLEAFDSQGIDKDSVKDILSGVPTTYIDTTPTNLTVSLFIEGLNSLNIPLHLRFKLNEVYKRLSKYGPDEYIYNIVRSGDGVWLHIRNILDEIMDHLSSKSYAKQGIQLLIEMSESEPESDTDTPIDDIVKNLLMSDGRRVSLIYMPEVKTARTTIAKLVNSIFRYKKAYPNTQNILIVIDEAHEFIPRDPRGMAGANESNEALERLFRQGRKYGVGGWIATQRVAHLNTNILQQLHSYFISILPRSYDRRVVAEAFSISKSLVDTVVTFDRGEWLFVSHVATRYPNIPVRIKAYNNEEFLVRWIGKVIAT